MEFDTERYQVIGNLDRYGRRIDLCSKCLDAVDDFIQTREEEDMDTSLRYKKVYRK
jgi:hypothetical protein